MIIITCDDDKKFVKDFSKQLKEICSNNDIVLSAKNGYELLELFEKQNYRIDLVFLDIEMQGLNGISLTKTIRDISPTTIVILVTNYEHYALDGYKARAFNYLLKPVKIELLKSALQEATKLIKTDDYFAIEIKKETIFLSFKDILYIESYSRKILYYTQNSIYETNEKFSDVVKAFESKDFYKVHKSYLVNLNYVDKVDKSNKEIDLLNGFKIPIGNRNIKDLIIKLIEVRKCYDNFS